MSTNPFFNFYGSRSEQNLLESLQVEAIRGVGITMVYLPRQLQKEDLILGEDVLSKFETSYEMPFYVKSIDRFGGQGDFLSKFGMEIEDTLTLVVAKTVFEQSVNDTLPYPREGDLIYFPLNQVLFEIKFMEDESVFYQLGKIFVYELRCEMFRYGNEVIQTGDPDIDNLTTDRYAPQYAVTLGSGSGNYVKEEWVYQGVDFLTSTAKARVLSWTSSPKALTVKFVAGQFTTTGGNIIGATSGASYAFASMNLQDNLAELRDVNKETEVEGNTVVNTTEKNPFGSY